jgi:hypothetical protein
MRNNLFGLIEKHLKVCNHEPDLTFVPMYFMVFSVSNFHHPLPITHISITHISIIHHEPV